MNGKYVKSKKVEILYGKNVSIESLKPMFWEVEGEIFSKESTKLDFKYKHNALNLIIPKGWNYELPRKEKLAKIKAMIK